MCGRHARRPDRVIVSNDTLISKALLRSYYGFTDTAVHYILQPYHYGPITYMQAKSEWNFVNTAVINLGACPQSGRPRNDVPAMVQHPHLSTCCAHPFNPAPSTPCMQEKGCRAARRLRARSGRRVRAQSGRPASAKMRLRLYRPHYVAIEYYNYWSSETSPISCFCSPDGCWRILRQSFPRHAAWQPPTGWGDVGRPATGPSRNLQLYM